MQKVFIALLFFMVQSVLAKPPSLFLSGGLVSNTDKAIFGLHSRMFLVSNDKWKGTVEANWYQDYHFGDLFWLKSKSVAATAGARVYRHKDFYLDGQIGGAYFIQSLHNKEDQDLADTKEGGLKLYENMPAFVSGLEVGYHHGKVSTYIEPRLVIGREIIVLLQAGISVEIIGSKEP